MVVIKNPLGRKFEFNEDREELIEGIRALVHLWGVASRCRFDVTESFKQSIESALGFSSLRRNNGRGASVKRSMCFDPTIPQLSPLLEKLRRSKWIQEKAHVPLVLEIARAYKAQLERTGRFSIDADSSTAIQTRKELADLKFHFGEATLSELGEIASLLPYSRLSTNVLAHLFRVSERAWTIEDSFAFTKCLYWFMGSPTEIVKQAMPLFRSFFRLRKRMVNLSSKVAAREVRGILQTETPVLLTLSHLVDLRIGRRFREVVEFVRQLYPTLDSLTEELTTSESIHVFKVVIDSMSESEDCPTSFEKALVRKLLKRISEGSEEWGFSDASILLSGLVKVYEGECGESLNVALTIFAKILDWFSKDFSLDAGPRHKYLIVTVLEALAELQALDPERVELVAKKLPVRLSSRWFSSEFRTDYYIRAGHAFATLGLNKEAASSLSELAEFVKYSKDPGRFAGPVGHPKIGLAARVHKNRSVLLKLLIRTGLAVGKTLENVFGEYEGTVVRTLDPRNKWQDFARNELRGLEQRMYHLLVLLNPANGWSVKTDIFHSTFVRTYEVDFALQFDERNVLVIEVDSPRYHNIFGNPALGRRGRDLLKDRVLNTCLVRVSHDDVGAWEKLSPSEAVKVLIAHLAKAEPTLDF